MKLEEFNALSEAEKKAEFLKFMELEKQMKELELANKNTIEKLKEDNARLSKINQTYYEKIINQTVNNATEEAEETSYDPEALAKKLLNK